MATIVLDVTRFLIQLVSYSNKSLIFLGSDRLWQNLNKDNILILYYLDIIEAIVFGFCDFIAQSILVRTTSGYDSDADRSYYSSKFSKIYRCWVVWGHNIRVVTIPSILAFAFLGPLTYFIYSLN